MKIMTKNVWNVKMDIIFMIKSVQKVLLLIVNSMKMEKINVNNVKKVFILLQTIDQKHIVILQMKD